MGSTGGAGVAVGVVVFVVVLLIGILVGISIKTLDSSEVAIQYNNFYKTMKKEPFFEGLHLGPPGYKFITFPSVFKTLSYSGVECLNKDGVSIVISASFQYRVRTSALHRVVNQFKDNDGYTKVLRYTGSSAVHDSCSLFNTSQFQAERGNFQEDLTSRLVAKFEKLDCDVTDLQVNNIQRPRAYENAIRDKESAREDIEVATNERPRQVTEARTGLRTAETEANIIINEANTESNIIMNRATNDAQGILNDYIQEAASYKNLKEANGLDNEGFLAYMGIRAISNAKNPVHVGMESPAKTNYA